MTNEVLLRTRNALADRLRSALGVRPPRWNRPWSMHATISDLFPWRGGTEWDTKFDVMNLSSVLMPDAPAAEDVNFVLFDDFGHQLREERFSLDPFSMRELKISDFTPAAGQGTFACFHALNLQCTPEFSGGHLTERNYVSYRNLGSMSLLWSYVHGNTYALSRRDAARMHSIAGRPTSEVIYRPQLRFDDCLRFELVFSNTTSRELVVRVKAFDDAHKLIKQKVATVPASGMVVIAFDNADGGIATVENEGRHFMWRPVLFKHYQTGFDVLHS